MPRLKKIKSFSTKGKKAMVKKKSVKSKTQRRKKVAASRSSSSSLALSNPFSLQNKKLIITLFVGIGIIAAFFIYRSYAADFTAGAVANNQNCTSNGMSRVADNESNTKRGALVCQISSDTTYTPDTFGHKGKDKPYIELLSELNREGYTGALTCVHMRAVNNSATVSIKGLGEKGSSRDNLVVTSGDYEEYCIQSSIDSPSQNASVTVQAGSVRVSSILIAGAIIVTPPPSPNEGGYVTPDNIGSTVGAISPSSSRSGTVSLGSGDTLSDTTVNGCIIVSSGAQNVTIQNVNIVYKDASCNTFYGIRTNEGSDVKVLNVTINCTDSASKGMYADGTADVTVDRVEFTNCDDAMFFDGTSGTTNVTNSVIHNTMPGTEPSGVNRANSPHTDGIQIAEFETTTGTMNFEGNYWAYDRTGCCQNAAIFVAGNPSNLTVNAKDNYFEGDFGTYIIRCWNDVICNVENNTIHYVEETHELATYFVHFDPNPNGINSHTIRCNVYSTGGYISNNLIQGRSQETNGC